MGYSRFSDKEVIAGVIMGRLPMKPSSGRRDPLRAVVKEVKALVDSHEQSKNAWTSMTKNKVTQASEYSWGSATMNVTQCVEWLRQMVAEEPQRSAAIEVAKALETVIAKAKQAS